MKLKQIKNDKHISDLTLGEVEDLIREARLEGWESDDGFLLSCEIRYEVEE